MRRLRPDIYLAEDLDDQLATADHSAAFKPTMRYWTRTTREALGMPAADLARALQISQPAATKLEASEAAGTISIAKLEAIASAMNCEFVYGFVPNRAFQATAKEMTAKQRFAASAKRKMPRYV